MTWILRKLMRPGDFEAAMGDLVEEYAIRRRETTLASATIWYWSQIARSVPSSGWAWARRTSALITLSIAAGAFVLANLLEGSIIALVSRVVELRNGQGIVAMLLIGLGSLFLASYVATAYRRAAAGALAVIVFLAVAILILVARDSVPAWYQIGFLVGGPATCMAASVLRYRRSIKDVGKLGP